MQDNWAQLLHRWKSAAASGESQRLDNLQEYRALSEGLLSSGSPLQALESAEEGLVYWPDDLELACLKARALARSGNTRAAAEQLEALLTRLRAQPVPDHRLLEEAVGVLARTEKDRAFASHDPAVRQPFLLRSLNLYLEAYAQSGGYWTGINAATLATLSGNEKQGQQIAREILQKCLPMLNASQADSSAYWLHATLGEAYLNLTDWANAEQAYRQASALAGKRYGDIRSMQRHVEWLLEHFQQDPTWTKKWLRLPSVAVFTGHMIDSPSRTAPRFPAHLEALVAQAIEEWIAANDVGIGFGSAACGSDLLFMEALQRIGAETHIILPFSEDEFLKSSVEIGAPGNWGQRFNQVIERATSVIRTTREKTLEHAETYRHANHVIAGMARIKARELGTDLLGLAVWDGQAGSIGGAAEAAQEWSNLGIPMTRVAVSSPQRAGGGLELEPVVLTNTRRELSDRKLETPLMFLLFADVVGYSLLNDEEIRIFATRVFSEIADLIKPYGDSIVIRQTAGDGIYLAFSDLSAAGSCALAMSRYFEQSQWQERGFRSNLRLRTALHAGPIIIAHDAITGALIGVGAHVNRAARLEPKTPPGQVYASETFAALAALQSGLPFTCNYVKQLEWAKRYGTFPTYLVT